MNRKLKALGLALFAMMALGAIAAQGAMAEEIFESEAGGETTYFTGVQENGAEIVNHFVLDDRETNPSTLTCEEAIFTGEGPSAGAGEVEVSPTYHGCTSGEATVTVNPTECTFVLYAHTTEWTEETVTHAPVTINCPEGQAIHITISEICEITVTTDHDITHGAIYHNKGLGGGETPDITATITAHTINWHVSKNEFLCTLGGLGASEGEDATYFSSVTIKGYADAQHTEQVGIRHNEP